MAVHIVKELPVFQYSWSIPSISPFKQSLIVSGYVRKNYPSKKKLPKVIMSLFLDFYTPNDLHNINDIRSGRLDQPFSTRPFSIFGIKFELSVYPHGVTSAPDEVLLALDRVSDVSHLKSFKISVVFFIMDYIFITRGNFKIGNNLISCARDRNHDFIHKNVLKFNQIQNIPQLLFKVEMQLIEMIDNNGNNLTKKVVKYSQENDCLFLNFNQNKQDSSFKNWISNKLKLPQYYDLFMLNGIEDLETLKLIDANPDILNKIGITKIGHILKILNMIKKINKSDKNKNKNTIGYRCKRSFDDFNDNETQINNHNKPPCKKQKI